MNLAESLNFTADGLLASTQWLRVTNLLCLIGVLFAGLSAFRHFQMRKVAVAGGTPSRNLWSGIAVLVLISACLIEFLSIWNRGIEVNHFPSQTMSEVLVMFSWALLVSMLVLHFALKLERIGYGWAIVDDALLILVFLGVVFTNAYTTTLSTAQRDLPPALQSYWFAPHLSSLIFSYATLGIAGLVAIVYFSMRFWSGVFVGGRSKTSQIVVLGGLCLVPFAHVVTFPVLLVVGIVFCALKMFGALPTLDDLSSAEKTMDQVSYRAFSVGIPFLTAGLFMGAFWAQEAWANYWGWDSKENAALISWLVYVIYIHLRMLGGYRGEKAMAVLAAGALSVFFCFQIFGYLPDSQKSLHRYTDDDVVPREGQQGKMNATESARADTGISLETQER